MDMNSSNPSATFAATDRLALTAGMHSTNAANDSRRMGPQQPAMSPSADQSNNVRSCSGVSAAPGSSAAAYGRGAVAVHRSRQQLQDVEALQALLLEGQRRLQGTDAAAAAAAAAVSGAEAPPICTHEQLASMFGVQMCFPPVASSGTLTMSNSAAADRARA